MKKMCLLALLALLAACGGELPPGPEEPSPTSLVAATGPRVEAVIADTVPDLDTVLVSARAFTARGVERFPNFRWASSTNLQIIRNLGRWPRQDTVLVTTRVGAAFPSGGWVRAKWVRDLRVVDSQAVVAERPRVATLSPCLGLDDAGQCVRNRTMDAGATQTFFVVAYDKASRVRTGAPVTSVVADPSGLVEITTMPDTTVDLALVAYRAPRSVYRMQFAFADH